MKNRNLRSYGMTAVADTTLMELEQMAQAAECLKTLAHPHRLRMVEMLLQGEYTVGALAEACEIQSHVASEHLGKMKDRGLLKCTRRGRAVYYAVAEPGLASIMHCIQKRFGTTR
jgi:DNA-binding transcriptional ArsR family regulator